VSNKIDGPERVTARFSGSRWRLASILALGYFLMLFTIGIYRFWLVTTKRRFYWANTEIGGDALEYTGTAIQLLIGFLLALVIFLPLYGFFFYLSTQSGETAVMGYTFAAVFLYFLAGYAIYRARRFRLTRTLWRGIRFHLSGSAWNYAFRRFFWSIITVLSAGLAYPFMAANLWRYRYNNTWYGDRRFNFGGSWRTIAVPFYANYGLFAGSVIGAFLLAGTQKNGRFTAEMFFSNLAAVSLGIFAIVVASLSYFFLLSRITSAMFSTVCAGRARLKVKVSARSLFWQYLAYAILVFMVIILALGIFGVMTMDEYGRVMKGGDIDLAQLLRISWTNLVFYGLFYLTLLAIFSILSQTILGLGYWRLVANGAVIENADDLKSVRASGEESTLVGEGLADALNVGAY